MMKIIFVLCVFIILMIFITSLNNKDFFKVPDECKNLHIKNSKSVDSCKQACGKNCNRLVKDFLKVFDTARPKYIYSS